MSGSIRSARSHGSISDFWNDPLPAHVRERVLNLEDGFLSTSEILLKKTLRGDKDTIGDRLARGDLVDNSVLGLDPDKECLRQDAQTLGFTDAEQLDKIKGSWSRAGDVRK